mgnify:CR=1 FL=1
MTIFFTSDHHFNHINILSHCQRPFSSVQEMDEEMISRWNSVVKEKDEVYYLGDFTLGNWATAWSYIKRLKGKIKFIEGNHDWRWFSKLSNEQKLLPIHELKYNHNTFVLCHYPLRGWNKSFRGSYHLFGHEHGNMLPYGKSFDIGVDCWDFYPVSIEQVIDKMKEL